MTPDIFIELLRTDFRTFAQKAFAELHPGVPFADNWHLDAITHALGQMAAGTHRRQIITMPPRSLKSMMASVAWPAFLLGQNPGETIVVASYNETLAEKLSTDTRRLMESDFYQATFPGTKLIKRTSLQLATDRGGTRYATSVGGPTTGFGGNWIIIDDPHNAAESHSPSAREAVKNYYRRALSSRPNDQTIGKFLLVMQRLHADDLAGHLLGGAVAWRELKLQACATEAADIEIGPGTVHAVEVGDLLHTRRLPQSVLDEKKLEMGSSAFQAQYQQEPVPDGGNMIKREWLRYLDIQPERTDAEIVLSLDTATKTNPANDYSACTVWLKKDGDHYLLHVWREKVDFPTLKRKIIDLYEIYDARKLLIEDQGAGTSLIQELHSVGIPAIARKARDSKDARLSAASAFIEGGRMFLPKDAPWLADFETELLGFPGAKHDDQVDSLSQYFGWVRERPTCTFSCDWGWD